MNWLRFHFKHSLKLAVFDIFNISILVKLSYRQYRYGLIKKNQYIEILTLLSTLSGEEDNNLASVKSKQREMEQEGT